MRLCDALGIRVFEKGMIHMCGATSETIEEVDLSDHFQSAIKAHNGIVIASE